jgi:hypothetical protein
MTSISQADSISPESFNELWNSGNKFRLMRLQAESLNPYSDMYSSGDIKTSYFETSQSYKLKQDESLERTIGSAHVAVNSDHYFVDLGVMDLRDQVGEREGITNKYSRIFLGARYNDLEYIGFSGGLLVSESPKISDNNAFIEYKNDTTVDPFINISLLDINLMLAEVKQDNLIVETLSYGYSYSDYSAKLYRSKIHGNKHNDSISYYDEYTLKLSHKTRCLDNSQLDMIGDCKINVSRRLTYNDQSQGWSFSVDRPYFIMNINTFDEVTELRQDKWGGSIKFGLNFFDKTTPKHGLKLMLSASYNDGITDIFEVPDSLMFGFNFEILGILNSLESIAKKPNKPTVSNQSTDDIK